jgi:signal transduction histidine kinase
VGLKGRLPARVEILFYRIAQEGLTNIAKHSQASHVDMRLTYSFPQVIFFIRDNGIGFKPASAPFSQAGRGIGLIGMRERAAAVGGKIDIQSAPGKGAQLRVTVTIDSADRV